MNNRHYLVLTVLLCAVIVYGFRGSAPSKPAGTQKSKSPEPTPAVSTRDRHLVILAVTYLRNIDGSLLQYWADKNEYPESEGKDILDALTKRNDLNEDGIFDDKWMDPKDIVDPWGNPFHYEWPNTKVKNAKKPAVWSNGPNGKNENGGGDDVTNWKLKSR